MKIMRMLTYCSKTTLFLIITVCLSLFPLLVLADEPDANFGNVKGFVTNIINFISDVLVPLVFALSLLLFLWGMFVYFIAGGGDESKRAQGKSLMLWAIIALVVMVTIWAIVKLFANGLEAGLGTGRKEIKTLPGVSVE